MIDKLRTALAGTATHEVAESLMAVEEDFGAGIDPAALALIGQASTMICAAHKLLGHSVGAATNCGCVSCVRGYVFLKEHGLDRGMPQPMSQAEHDAAIKARDAREAPRVSVTSTPVPGEILAALSDPLRGTGVRVGGSEFPTVSPKKGGSNVEH